MTVALISQQIIGTVSIVNLEYVLVGITCSVNNDIKCMEAGVFRAGRQVMRSDELYWDGHNFQYSEFQFTNIFIVYKYSVYQKVW